MVLLFYEYDDRIEVQNPGGLYGKVSPANFPNVSDYRNPFIAEAMKVLGYVNRFSRGVYRVQKELTENGNGAAFFDFSLITAFRVTERVSEKYFEAGFGADNTQETSKKHTGNIQKTTQETTQEEVNTTQKIILKALKDKPETTQKELAKLIGISIDGIKYHIQKMTKEGIIKHEGSTKAGKWIILSE
jgi:ATP-dependent DNA helicase RecG